MSHKDTSHDQNTTTIESDRQRIQQILSENGFNPSDYLFNSNTSNETTDHPSAFSKYSQPETVSSRPLTYVQQPPPPPVINRRPYKPQSPSNMSQRRTPPPPPPPPLAEYQSKEKNEHNYSAEHYLRQIDQEENPPVKVVKPNPQNVVYKKEIRIRYLQPPTPPPPAPIIIREKHLPPKPPESPLLIRERKPEPRTPPPLTIRERPPSPPPLLEPYIIEKPIPPPTPQPRQIIIERLPTPPPKPRTVIFEKWLPYKKVKRPILLQRAPPPPPVQPVRNVIIEYEPLKAYTVRRVIEEGIFRVDPQQFNSYTSQDQTSNVRIVDRIEDLPPPSEDILRVLQNYQQPTTPSSRQEQNYSPELNSSIPSPTIVPLKQSQNKPPNSNQ